MSKPISTASNQMENLLELCEQFKQREYSRYPETQTAPLELFAVDCGGYSATDDIVLRIGADGLVLSFRDGPSFELALKENSDAIS